MDFNYPFLQVCIRYSLKNSWKSIIEWLKTIINNSLKVNGLQLSNLLCNMNCLMWHKLFISNEKIW